MLATLSAMVCSRGGSGARAETMPWSPFCMTRLWLSSRTHRRFDKTMVQPACPGLTSTLAVSRKSRAANVPNSSRLGVTLAEIVDLIQQRKARWDQGGRGNLASAGPRSRRPRAREQIIADALADVASELQAERRGGTHIADPKRPCRQYRRSRQFLDGALLQERNAALRAFRALHRRRGTRRRSSRSTWSFATRLCARFFA